MVKVNMGSQRPEPIEVGDAEKVILSHSESSPGTFHISVKLSEPVMVKRFGGEVTALCSCRGFMNHRKCWHLAWLVGEDSDE
jgi:hypothetical protein